MSEREQVIPLDEAPELVSLYRDQLDETEWFGYVVAESDDYLAIHCVSDRYDLDGYRVFRASDIEDIDVDFDRRELIERAMELKGLAPIAVPWLRLDSVRELIDSIQENEPIVVVEREIVCPDECEVGRVHTHDDDTYSLLWMTTTAEWEDDDRQFRFDDITQVSFGGEYERTLALLAGPAPVRPD